MLFWMQLEFGVITWKVEGVGVFGNCTCPKVRAKVRQQSKVRCSFLDSFSIIFFRFRERWQKTALLFFFRRWLSLWQKNKCAVFERRLFRLVGNGHLL
jgi:hypothetical protein